MVLDVRSLEVMLLVNVAVEHGDIAVGHEELDRLIAVARRPVPLRVKRKERPVREHHDARVALLLAEIVREPGQLLIADARRGVGDVIERDEVHALVIEGVVRRAEELLIGGARVERGVMLAGHQPDLLGL